ncbi:winged helix DNA-binding domain-containing protein [Verrucomicrobiota bacterium sgz303538]
MSPVEITSYRLANQQITHPTCKTPQEVVSALGAMQAQDYPGALWAIGLRLPGSTEMDIQQAVADRAIVRTWPMRGTLHFVAAPDVRWMLEHLTPRIIAGSARRQQQLELDGAVFARCEKVFVKALQGGKQLTRDEMYETLERSGITAGQRGYHILWRLAQEGILCFGAHAGKQPTFALLDEWIPSSPKLERDESLAKLALRYFTSHGPASLHDFVWWSGLKVADARAGIDLAAAQLTHEKVDGQTYWMAVGMAPVQNAEPAVSILPGFDEYLLGYTDRSASLNPVHAQKVVPGNNGMFMPTVVKNGRVVGTWKRTLKTKKALFTATPFASFKKAETRAIEAAAKHYGRFLGLPVELRESAKP